MQSQYYGKISNTLITIFSSLFILTLALASVVAFPTTAQAAQKTTTQGTYISSTIIHTPPTQKSARSSKKSKRSYRSTRTRYFGPMNWTIFWTIVSIIAVGVIIWIIYRVTR